MNVVTYTEARAVTAAAVTLQAADPSKNMILVPLSRLVLRPTGRNVRKTPRMSIPELAASIQRVGLLQNLIVIPAADGEHYEVVAGGRRFAALKLLAKKHRIAKDWEVPCLQVADGTARTASLTENVQREAMLGRAFELSCRECPNSCVRGAETCPRRRSSLATNDRRGGQVGLDSHARFEVKAFGVQDHELIHRLLPIVRRVAPARPTQPRWHSPGGATTRRPARSISAFLKAMDAAAERRRTGQSTPWESSASPPTERLSARSSSSSGLA